MRHPLALFSTTTCALFCVGCFTDPAPVQGGDGASSGLEAEGDSTDAGSTDAGSTDTGSTGVGSTSEASTGAGSTTTPADGSTGAAGTCACGLDPDVGLWCSPDVVEPSGAALCPPDLANRNGQACDSVDPPLTEDGCCVDGGTIALCYEGQILVELCSPETFDGCP